MPRKIIVLIFVIITLCIGMPMFFQMNAWGIQDWDYAAGHGALQQISYTVFKQIPLWNPYYCGGMSNIGNPETDFLSPFFLPIIIFGPVVGYKIAFFIFEFIGLVGFYLLGSLFSMSLYARILMGISYMASGLYIIPFTGGMTMYLALSFLPYLLYWFIRVMKGHTKSVVGVAFTLSMMYLFGFHYIAIILLFLMILSFFWSLVNINIKPLIFSAIAIILFFSLTAFKVLPSLDTGNKFPRLPYEITSGYSVESLLFGLFSRNQSFEKFDSITNLNFMTFWNNRSYTHAENGMYVGIAVMVLFFIGLLFKGYKHLPLVLTLGIMIWLVFGYNISPSLYEFLRKMPIFQYMRVAQRYRYPGMLIVSIFSGLGFDICMKGLSRIVRKPIIVKIIGTVVVSVIFLDITSVNSTILSKAFILPPQQIAPSGTFRQNCTDGTYYTANGRTKDVENYASWHSVFPYVIANYGVTNHCGEPLSVTNAVSCLTDESYKNEVFLSDQGGSVTTLYWSPNRLRYQFTGAKEGSSLIVNQNYDAGWHAIVDNNKSEIQSSDGKISVPLYSAEGTVELYYLPKLFIFGLLISILTATGLIGFFIADKIIQFRKKNQLKE